MAPKFLAWQIWGVISSHLPNRRHMRMLPQELAGPSPPFPAAARSASTYIFCAHSRECCPLTLRQADKRGIFGNVRCAGRPGRRQVTFLTLEGMQFQR